MSTTPKIALGTWSWGVGSVGGDRVFGNHLDTSDLQPVFDEAMKQGLSFWDTAYVYGRGSSETILGKVMAKYPRASLTLSTKFTPRIADESAENPVETMFAGSLSRLGTDYVDLYWIHHPLDVKRWTPYLIPLVKSGKVKRVGLSNHNLAQIKEAEEILSAEGIHVSAVQNHYSLVYRDSEDAGILEYCQEHHIDFFAYMVLEQGVLGGKYDVDHPLPADSQRGKTYNPMFPQLMPLITKLRELGAAHDASAAEIAIAWAIAKGTVPLIGVTSVPQVDDAAKAASVSLSADEMAALEQIAKEAKVNTRGAWETPMD